MNVRTRLSVRLAVAMLVAAGGPALAQEPAQMADSGNPPAVLGDDSAVLGQALTFDPATLAAGGSAKSLKYPSLKHPKTFDVSRTNAQPDGSGTVVVKQTLLPDWDTKVGADIGLAADDPTTYRPQTPLDSYARNGSSGAAWASVGVSNMATIDARVDPTNDQGRLAGTLKHSLPVGDSLSVTLQNSVSVTDTYGAQAPTGPSGLPVMALPPGTGTSPSHVYGDEQALKFDVLPTGTSLAAGVTTASNDPVTHNTLSAQQKLLGPLSVTTSVTDVGQTTVSKSISAGFKLNW